MTDSPGGTYPASANTYVSTRSSWNTTGYTSCAVSFHAQISKLSDAALSLQAFNNETNAWQTLYSSFPDSADQDFTFSARSLALDNHTGVKLRFRLATGAAGGDGVHIKNVRFTCAGLPADSGQVQTSSTNVASSAVAAAAALIWSRYPSESVADVRQAILDGAYRVGALSGTSLTGARLNAATALIRADHIPPVTTLASSGPSGPVNNPVASFAFSASEVATFQCSLDGGGWTACASGVSYGPLADGDHSFSVRAIDGNGNDELAPVVRHWTVDTVAPATVIVSGPDGFSASANPTFEFVASDDAVGFECRLDYSGWKPCSNPLTWSGLSDGVHTLIVRAVDAAGNADPTPASRQFRVQTQGPASAHSASKPHKRVVKRKRAAKKTSRHSSHKVRRRHGAHRRH
jgi:hypothetical protein